MTDIEMKGEQNGYSRKMIVVVTVIALLIFLAFTFLARSPKARLNVVQMASLIFFTAVILRHGRTGAASLPEPHSALPSKGVRWELLLAPILGACLYASTLSSYFISDDYAHLF